MGHKSIRKRKYISFLPAVSCIILVFNFAACSPVQKKFIEFRTHQQLEQYRGNMAAGIFETVIDQSKQILAEDETKPPADVAFYALGEVYAHHDFAGRDYTLSKYYFKKLIENFPDSNLTSEAKTYISLFDTIDAKEALKRENEPVLKKQVKENGQIAKEKNEVSLQKFRTLDENHDFDKSTQENLNILKKAGKQKPADRALYNLGLIYAHQENPANDYKKAKLYFLQLTQDFPDSELVAESRIWLGLFETLEKIQQIDIDIEQQKKELTR